MPFALINGARIAYDVAGRGRPVVLLHAGLEGRRQWDREFAELGAAYRVVRCDLRGYGESDVPPGPASLAEDVAALADQLQVRDAVLIGNSVGAGVALDVSLTRPDLVRALVLVGPAVGGRAPGPPPTEALRRRELLARGDLEGAAEEHLRLWLDGPSRPRGAVGGALRDRLHRAAVTLSRRQRDEWKTFEARELVPPAAERLGEIRVPTLVIVGAHEVPFITANARFLAAEIAGARLVVMEDAAHFPNLERPELFGQILSDFLTRVDERAGV